MNKLKVNFLVAFIALIVLEYIAAVEGYKSLSMGAGASFIIFVDYNFDFWMLKKIIKLVDKLFDGIK